MSEIKLIHADSLEAMWGMADNAFELAIVDPNYGIKEDGRKNHTRGLLAIAKNYSDRARYDDQCPPDEYFEQLKRVSKNQIVFGVNYYPIVLGKGRIFWDKDNSGDFSDGELAYQSFTDSVRMIQIRWNGMLQYDMKNKETRIHPNQKPIALYKWLLTNYAQPGDKILDTHGGSMSIAIACHDLGYDLELYELDADYYRDGVNRYQNHAAQKQAFIETPQLKLTQTKMFKTA